MSKNDWFTMILALLAGGGLGTFFMLTLWLTIERLPRAQLPWSFYFFSLILRMLVVLGGFAYLASYQDWRILVAAVIGFVLIRTLGVRMATRSIQVRR